MTLLRIKLNEISRIHDCLEYSKYELQQDCKIDKNILHAALSRTYFLCLEYKYTVPDGESIRFLDENDCMMLILLNNELIRTKTELVGCDIANIIKEMWSQTFEQELKETSANK